jgi:hypothetical protein
MHLGSQPNEMIMRTLIKIGLAVLVVAASFGLTLWLLDQFGSDPNRPEAALAQQPANPALQVRAAPQPPSQQQVAAVARRPEGPVSGPPNLQKRVSDLGKIREALEAYRRKNGSYPASPSNTWSRLYDGSGKINREWIPGLAPAFINELPRDPRNLEVQTEQYVYISDGENYKLLAGYPEKDCDVIKQNRPEMMDPVRNKGEQCEAYGYWSAGAQGL